MGENRFRLSCVEVLRWEAELGIALSVDRALECFQGLRYCCNFILYSVFFILYS